MRHSIYNKILETASDMFYSNGYESTSLSDIAQKCGCTKQALSYHFGSKEALGQEVCMHYINSLSSGFFKIVEHGKKDTAMPDEANLIAYLLWSSAIFYSKDKKAFRFYKEFIYRYPDLSTLQGNVFELYKSFFKQLSCETNDTNIEMCACKALYASSGLLFRYIDGRLNCTSDEFLHFYFESFVGDIVSDVKKRNELFEAGMAVIKGHTFYILPNYNVV